MVTKPKLAAEAVVSSSDSYKNLTYKFASASQSMRTIAQAVYEKNPSLATADEISEEVLSEMKEGAALKWQEMNPAVGYSSEWIPTQDDKPAVVATLAMALSYSPQALNSLKKDDPVKRDVLFDLHTRFRKYFNALKNRLIGELKRIEKERNGESVTRNPAADFAKYLDDTLTSIKARCKTSSNRGDATADLTRIESAIVAFKAAYNRPVSGG